MQRALLAFVVRARDDDVAIFAAEVMVAGNWRVEFALRALYGDGVVIADGDLDVGWDGDGLAADT